MSDNFKVLTDREHVLARTGMYAGSIVAEPIYGIIDYKWQSKMVVPALLKTIEEVVQNSIDEHVRTKGEFATKIDLLIEDVFGVPNITVEDNGRGIPVKPIGDSYQPVVAWTELRAGSNFSDDGRVVAGAHGIGSSMTNILSKEFIGISCDGVNKCVVTCTDNMKNVDFKVSKCSTNRGVKVSFIPDLAHYKLTEFTQDHTDVIKDRLINLAILHPTITFSFNGEKIKFKNIKQVAKNFHENAISLQGDNFSFVFAPSGSDEEFRCLSYVNGIYVKNGGSHVDYILGKIVDSVRDFVKKKHKIDVPPNQIKQHILFASWINNFPNLKFDSQTKERITNSQGEVSAALGSIDYEKVAKQILATPDIIDPMISSILYKKELAERLALAKKQKAATKIRVAKHIAATDPDVENRMLLLAEGDSAMSTLIKVRDSKTTGGYPLRGKPLNVRGMKPIDIVKNKEMFELMSVVGLELGKPAATLELFRVELDGCVYIVGKDDIILHNGKEIAASDVI